MSDETEKLRSITLDSLKEQWPKSDDGRLCSRLLQRYCFTLLVNCALDADCGPMTAQASAGAQKAIAKMTNDFGELATPSPKKEAIKPMQRLHRFEPPNDQK